jgi:hypothetical protein
VYDDGCVDVLSPQTFTYLCYDADCVANFRSAGNDVHCVPVRVMTYGLCITPH